MAFDVVGVDVSFWQGVMNWAKTFERAQFVFIRSSQGMSTTDARFISNWSGSKTAGMVRGAYHYFVPRSNMPANKTQAEFFWRHLEADPGELPPVVDLETDGGLNKVDLEGALNKFVTRIQELSGQKPIIYSRKSFMDIELPLTDWLWKYPLWVANYTSAVEPLMPAEWTNHNQDWQFWQWSADGNGKGFEYGAQSDDIDLDRYNGTVVQFNNEFGTNIGVITPEPEEKQVVVTSALVNARAAPTSLSEDLGDVMRGSVLRVDRLSGDYYHVPEFWVYRHGVKDK